MNRWKVAPNQAVSYCARRYIRSKVTQAMGTQNVLQRQSFWSKREKIRILLHSRVHVDRLGRGGRSTELLLWVPEVRLSTPVSIPRKGSGRVKIQRGHPSNTCPSQRKLQMVAEAIRAEVAKA
jgi:hypothetical protein